jgi:hypothetical protein
MIVVEKSIKQRFFDRAAVQNAISRQNLKVLSKAGAFVRRRARTKLRRRKGVSPAGTPPSVHSQDTFATLKNILFGLHRDHESVVIGPRFVRKLKRSSRSTVPELMEYGGTSLVTFTWIGNSPGQFTDELGRLRNANGTFAKDLGGWVPGDRRYGRRKNAPIKTVSATYQARPFMGPALREEAAAGTISSLYLYG